MKAKSGFVLRSIMGEQMLMPINDNIATFKGTVLFNETAALLWEKLQTPVSREDLAKTCCRPSSTSMRWMKRQPALTST